MTDNLDDLIARAQMIAADLRMRGLGSPVAPATIGSDVLFELLAALEAQSTELAALHSWDGLMTLLDEHWPEDLFPTLNDDDSRDTGPRIVSLLRWYERTRAERDAARTELAQAERDRDDLAIRYANMAAQVVAGDTLILEATTAAAAARTVISEALAVAEEADPYSPAMYLDGERWRRQPRSRAVQEATKPSEPSAYARFAKIASRFPADIAKEIGLWMRSAGYDPTEEGEHERWAKDYNMPHEFRPVAGHPDDDECTDRRDGTDATYCGLPRRLHGYPRPEPSEQYDAEEAQK